MGGGGGVKSIMHMKTYFNSEFYDFLKNKLKISVFSNSHFRLFSVTQERNYLGHDGRMQKIIPTLNYNIKHVLMNVVKENIFVLESMVLESRI